MEFAHYLLFIGSMTPTKGHPSLELIFQLKGLAFYVASLSSLALITQR